MNLTRRRFLSISAASLVLSGAARAAGGAPASRWRGTAMGAGAAMTLIGLTPDAAAATFAAVEREVARLEAVFSLHRANSALATLNRDGALKAPPPELREVLALCDALHRTTEGAFDPSIQPLWALHAEAAAAGRRPSASQIAAARARAGWAHVRLDDGDIGFARKGMALTLNGVAQGYVADRVAALLRARGLADVLVDMGEIAAMGRRADGTPWRAGLATPDGRIVRRMRLDDRALATSAPLGTLLDRAGRVGHIVDPRTGAPGGLWKLVSVSAAMTRAGASRAALADGLSTAFCLMPRGEIDAALAAHPGVALEAALDA